MFKFFAPQAGHGALATSRLFDEKTFYKAFTTDLGRCRDELVIESPFISASRMATLRPVLLHLVRRGVRVVINTRQPSDHEQPFDRQSQAAIDYFLSLGIRVLFTGNHHRKLAIIDRHILWEGSLNILSQGDSCEIMRRIASPELASEMICFTKLDRFLQ